MKNLDVEIDRYGIKRHTVHYMEKMVKGIQADKKMGAEFKRGLIAGWEKAIHEKKHGKPVEYFPETITCG